MSGYQDEFLVNMLNRIGRLEDRIVAMEATIRRLHAAWFDPLPEPKPKPKAKRRKGNVVEFPMNGR